MASDGIVRAETPGVSASEHNGLPIGGGRKVGDLRGEQLRRAAEALGVRIPADAGRAQVAQCYATEYWRRYNEAGKAAIADWFAGAKR